jgi:YidC/Oxa1 family membrane protein insertase
MEKRIILALAISFIIILIYYQFISPPPQPLKSEQEKTTIAKKEEVKVEEKYPQIKISPSIKDVEEKNVKVETPLFRALISNKGGVIKSFLLKRYKDEKGRELELIPDIPPENPFPLSLKFEEPLSSINNFLFLPSDKEINLKENEKKELTFTYSSENFAVLKKFIFYGNSYLFELEISILKDGVPILPSVYIGPRVGRFSPEEMKKRMDKFNIVYWDGGKLSRKEDKKFSNGEILKGYLKWCAYETNYFAIIAVPLQNSRILFESINQKKGEPLNYLVVSNPRAIFIGPKEFGTLKKTLFKGERIELEKVVNFGMFGFIAQFFLIILNWLYKMIPNYGVAIIILTIILKVVLFPLTWTSMVSMAKMQKAQPRIKALGEKYKKWRTDPEQRKKYNAELMNIYKEEGINPASGCLPLLLQLPILWGFLNLLSRAVEIRHKPFVLWIKDLSTKDPYYVIPILMGITQFILQKMTPSGGDPTQRKLMLILPVFLTIFFMNFPSGLVLYWLVQNIIQIGQQYLMNKYIYKTGKEHGKRIQRKKS